MTTMVVNLHSDVEYDVYIGRAGHGLDGYFGNPYPKGETCTRCGVLHEDGASTLHCFRMYFCDRLEVDAEFRVRVKGLKDKKLGCFCKPNACHGDVIADFLNRPDEEVDAHLDRLVKIGVVRECIGTEEGRRKLSMLMVQGIRNNQEKAHLDWQIRRKLGIMIDVDKVDSAFSDAMKKPDDE